MTRQYKYSCRECIPRVRNKCIQEAHISPGAKRIIERAFDSHTDTEATWDLLQANCLLLQRDEIVVGDAEPSDQSLLSRIRRRDQGQPSSGAGTEQAETPPIVGGPAEDRPNTLLGRMRSMLRDGSKNPGDRSTPAQDTVGMAQSIRSRLNQVNQPGAQDPAHAPTGEQPTLSEQTETLGLSTSQKPRSDASTWTGPGLCYPAFSRPQPSLVSIPGPKTLVAQSSGHRILLPEDGELILGRFDPMTRIKPDIDLTYEDRLTHAISRRHASINGWQGRYEITDLGSRNGTWVNGHMLALHSTPILHLGDEIRLGSVTFFFVEVPELHRKPSGQFFFYSTYTGRFFPLPNKEVILIGRADPALGYKPDIDLSKEGEAASVVSRRHAQLICKGPQFLIEDLGSAYKTRLDGRPVYVGTQMPILPGQHLWLGGCVLAFDVVAVPS